MYNPLSFLLPQKFFYVSMYDFQPVQIITLHNQLTYFSFVLFSFIHILYPRATQLR